MVVLTDSFTTQSTARRLLRGIGVPPDVLDATDAAHATVDWRGLAEALDAVFLSCGGGMGQSMFLRSRLPELHGLTPVEALPCASGPQVVCEAAAAFARQRAR